MLTATGDTQVQEIGLGLAAGILLDTFFVRTLLVPSVVVLLGRWNWWPSKLSHEDHSHDPVLPDEVRGRGLGPRRLGPDAVDGPGCPDVAPPTGLLTGRWCPCARSARRTRLAAVGS